MFVSAEEEYTSVAAIRKRSTNRVIDSAIPVRQDDYEARRSELQKYLVQKRRINQQYDRANPSRRNVEDSRPSDVPPLCEVRGSLQPRRRFIPREVVAGCSDGNASSLAKNSSPTSWVVRILQCMLLPLRSIPTKYLWIVGVVIMLVLRRFAGLMFPLQNLATSSSLRAEAAAQQESEFGSQEAVTPPFM